LANGTPLGKWEMAPIIPHPIFHEMETLKKKHRNIFQLLDEQTGFEVLGIHFNPFHGKL
jgi:hypothetical protein